MNTSCLNQNIYCFDLLVISIHQNLLTVVEGFVLICRYYEATIEEITSEKEEVSVIFDAYKNADVTNINLLREVSSGDPNDKNK